MGVPRPLPEEIVPMTLTFRRGALALAAAATLAVAGCGGDDEGGGGGGDALSKSELVEEANAICAKYAKEGDALKPPENIGDPSQAADFFDKANDIARRQQDDLEALTPAEDVKAQYDAMTRATGKATTLLADLTKAAESKDAEEGAKLLQDLQPVSDEVDKTARALGVTNCAS
jgi:hypothetical protein